MAEDRASIDGRTVLDDRGTRRVEFGAEIGGDWYAFAAPYAVLEALCGTLIGAGDDAAALFDAHAAEIGRAAAHALARVPADSGRIVLDESDIL